MPSSTYLGALTVEVLFASALAPGPRIFYAAKVIVRANMVPPAAYEEDQNTPMRRWFLGLTFQHSSG